MACIFYGFAYLMHAPLYFISNASRDQKQPNHFDDILQVKAHRKILVGERLNRTSPTTLLLYEIIPISNSKVYQKYHEYRGSMSIVLCKSSFNFCPNVCSNISCQVIFTLHIECILCW